MTGRQARCLPLLLTITTILVGPGAGQAWAGCCLIDHTCSAAASPEECRGAGTYSEGKCDTRGNCIQGGTSSGQGCSGSGSLSSTTVGDSLVFGDGGTCQVFASAALGGEEIETGLSGSVQVAFEPTANPALVQIRVEDLTGLGHPPLQFPRSGHTVEVTRMELLEQSFLLDTTKVEDNVTGTYRMRYHVLADGALQATLIENGELRATFDPVNRTFPEIVIFGLMTPDLAAVPVASAPALGALAALLGLAGLWWLRS